MRRPYGQAVKYRELAKTHGVKESTFKARVRRGWSLLRAATTPTRPYFYEWSQA